MTVLMRTCIRLAALFTLACAGCAPVQNSPQPAPSVPPSPAPTQVAATPAERTVTLAAVGDIMLGRYVDRRIAALGASYPFSATQQLLQGDLVLGNLESPLTSRRAASALRPGPYRLPADPAAVAGLQQAGFGALSLANNHALDAGPAGLEESAQVLQTAGIEPLGVGVDRNAARQPHILDINGQRIALLAANDVSDPQDQSDEGQGWGRAPLDNAFIEAVQNARTQADFVVVLVHWGQEYATAPGLRQREQADALVEAGADVVIGTHPHVLQPISLVEREGRRALVAYSLGNFVFDQPFSAETSRSAVLQLTLGATGVLTYTAQPVTIVDGQPRPLSLDSPDYSAVLHDLKIDPPVSSPPIASAPPQTAPATPGSAFRFDGTTFAPVPSVSDIRHMSANTLPISATADLRGDGSSSLLALDTAGIATLHRGASQEDTIVWRNEADNWRITQILPGDADNDGRYEFLLIIWKPDTSGVLRCHPFLLGWRGGRYRVFWGGSAVNEPIQAAALADVDGDERSELVVLEGGTMPGEEPASASVWRWHGWGFERVWRTPVAGVHNLTLEDTTNDGTNDIIVW